MNKRPHKRVCQECDKTFMACWRTTRFCDQRCATKSFYRLNPEWRRAKDKKVYQKHKEKRKDWAKAYYQKNKQRAYENNVRWRKENRDRVKLYRHNRELQIRRSIVGKGEFVVKPEHLADLRRRQRNCCALCGKRMVGNYSIDHIVPISKGGPHLVYNIQLAHKDCNSMKQAKVSEADILKTIMEYLHLKRVFCWRNSVGAVAMSYKGKKRFVRFGAVGSPDIFALKGGVLYGLEVKSATGKPTEEQLAFGYCLKTNGAVYAVVRSVDEVMKLL